MPSESALESKPYLAARAPGSAFASFVLGVPLLAIGAALLGWVLMMNLTPAQGAEWAVWAIQHSPIPLFLTPQQAATLAVQVPVLWAMGIAGAVFAGIGIEELWGARRNLRPANESDNRKVRMELAGPPRVGRYLEGDLFLLGKAQAGDAYDVRVTCSRRVQQKDAFGKDTSFLDIKYDQRHHAKATPSATGLKVPFRFAIPFGMPAEGAYHWELAVGPPKAFFPTKFPLDVQPLPAGDAQAIRDSIPDTAQSSWTHVEPTPGEKVLIAKIEKETQISPKVAWFLMGGVGLFFLVVCVIITINVLSKAFR